MRWRLPSARTVDLGGGLIAVMMLGWFGSYASAGDRPGGAISLVIGAASSFTAGRLISERCRIEVSTVVALGIAGALIVTYPGMLDAGGGPLGYANSNGTLASLGVVAATSSALTAKHRPAITAWTLLTLLLIAEVVTIGSLGAVASLAAAALLVAASWIAERTSAATLGGPVLVLLALAITTAIARGATIPRIEGHSEERVQLWAAAAGLVADRPLRGVGIGQFADQGFISPDPDLRWAHHEYLQLAAEGGVVALVLLLALLGWGYMRLGLTGVRSSGQAALGAGALTLVALHSTVDHVAHSAAVPLTLAVLLGAATARAHRQPGRGSPGSPHPRR